MQPSRTVFSKKYCASCTLKVNYACEACEQFETNTTTLVAELAGDGPPSVRMIQSEPGGYSIFSGSSFTEEAAMLS
jgi:hypothetical protein